MKANQKYFVGQVYDVWWEITEIISSSHRHYDFVLTNKQNGCVVVINDAALRNVANGKRRVSWYYHLQIVRKKRLEKVK